MRERMIDERERERERGRERDERSYISAVTHFDGTCRPQVERYEREDDR